MKSKDKEFDSINTRHDGKENNETMGDWSEIISVSTKESQSIDPHTLGSHAKVSLRGSEYCLQFDKAGIVTTTHEYSYGKVYWEIKLQQQSAHQSTDDTSALIKVGITNKVGKTFNVVGSLINYGMNKNSVRIRVTLDLENRILIIHPSNQSTGEVLNNLPDGPLYPAFQNKTNKNSNFSLKLFVTFDLPPYESEKTRIS
jgi:hypothetical protein